MQYLKDYLQYIYYYTSGHLVTTSVTTTVLLKYYVALVCNCQVVSENHQLQAVLLSSVHHASHEMNIRIQDMCHAPLISNFLQICECVRVRHYF